MNEKVLERYAEMMIEKIKQVSADEWQKPWFTPLVGMPQNMTGRTYNNMNRLMLYMEMDRMQYKLPVFMTFGQLKNEGLMIKKGSRAFPVIFYDISVKHKVTGEKIAYPDYKGLPELQKQEYKVTPFLKYYNVFNVDQTDFQKKYPARYEGMIEKFSSPTVPEGIRGKANEYLDKTIKNQKWVCPIELRQQGRAYFSSSEDKIVLPLMEQFKDKESFYMTALHEMAHSTGHASRLNRDLLNFFGTDKYAKEEIIAEFTAAVSGRDLGIAVSPRKENAQYLKGWLSGLQKDPKYITTVLREVGKASAMIEEGVGLQVSSVQGAPQKESPRLPDEFILKSSGRETSTKGITEQVEKMGINADVFKNAFPADIPCGTMYLYVANGKVTDWEPFIHENEYNLPILGLWAAECDITSGTHPEPLVMTENEYLNSKGLSSPLSDYMSDKTRIPHGETRRRKERREREALKSRKEYDTRKEEVRQEYREKVRKGELREPTTEEIKQNRIDGWIHAANGDASLERTQSARRVLEKRGIDWREPQVENPLLLFKGGRREIEITSGKAVIRTNGNEYDATGILKFLDRAAVDVKGVTESQWKNILRGQGIALDPAKPTSLFSIQKQAAGYTMRMADIANHMSSSIQKEL